MQSFIETQFPISKLSKESYKERKGSQGQSLTGLGKWWGRKPLILVRAVLLGILLPATEQPKRDREIFLKLLSMDEDGLWSRKGRSIPLSVVAVHLTPRERERWLTPTDTAGVFGYKAALTRKEREEIQRVVFARLSYDEKLDYCDLAEKAPPLPLDAWAEINAYLGTHATHLAGLVDELGQRRFGHTPRVGDAFCGGGSIPFEAARLGCDTYGSDLNPVAAFLTWASLNLLGGGEEIAAEIHHAQQRIYTAVDRRIQQLGIEQNEQGWRADTYLYCAETRCPECGWTVPLAPSWVIAERAQQVIARLKPDETRQCFEILIESGASVESLQAAREAGTVKDSALMCPHCHQHTPMAMLRSGLRLWEHDDLIPRPNDVFQERLYCVRWEETYENTRGELRTRRHYHAPDGDDLAREAQTLTLLCANIQCWQEQGYIPTRRIMPGSETSRPVRERGWAYWHHLFTPRELLVHGFLLQEAFEGNYTTNARSTALLALGRCIDFNSKLARWNPSTDKISPASTNPAFNTLFNFGSRSFTALENSWYLNIQPSEITTARTVTTEDARNVRVECDVWITDPPYADAIVYHELSEYFLSWYNGLLLQLFPEWYGDSKRALAVAGLDLAFRKSMVECYRNLAEHMSDDGYQVVMFTHQGVDVWNDLTLIMWASGLRVAAAWTISTETDSALKEGNYVQGTVLLVLRKQTSDETAFTDELVGQVEEEVKSQLASMLALEDKEEPNFSDNDYQLAAYAAAIRVLTRYKNIEDIDIAYELAKERKRRDESPIARLIADAVKVACDFLVPTGFDAFIWKTLTPEERFYLKGLDLGSHREYRAGVYQELARGFGLREYTHLLASGKANQTRLKTATEFGVKMLGDAGFGKSLVRHALFAIRETVRADTVDVGKRWLRDEVADYWSQRKTLIEVLRYLSNTGYTMPEHWKNDAEAARLLAGALENDH